MKNPEDLLKNLVPGFGYRHGAVEKAVAVLSPHAQNLEADHIRLDASLEKKIRKKGFYWS